jgi:hypothetical protein
MLRQRVRNGDLEGGFSDGSSAAGVQMRVEDAGARCCSREDGQEHEYTFKKPSGPYKVVFDAGEGTVIKVEGKAFAK